MPLRNDSRTHQGHLSLAFRLFCVAMQLVFGSNVTRVTHTSTTKTAETAPIRWSAAQAGDRGDASTTVGPTDDGNINHCCRDQPNARPARLGDRVVLVL